MPTQSAMPAMLMEHHTEYKTHEGPRSLMDEAVTIIKGINSRNWRDRKKAALEKLAALDNWYISSIIT